MLKVPEIRLDRQTHTYYRKDTGAKVPGLTTMLREAGLYDIHTWGEQNIYTGTLVHAMIAKGFCRDRAHQHWLRTFRRFCARTSFTPTLREVMLYNDHLGYACTADIIGHFDHTATLGFRQQAVVEIKLPGEPHAAGIQTAAQKLAAIRNGLATPDTRCGMVEIGPVEFNYTDLTDHKYEQMFTDIVLPAQARKGAE